MSAFAFPAAFSPPKRTSYNNNSAALPNRNKILMPYVYCLFATDDGAPKFVASCLADPEYALKKHVTSGLEMQPGAEHDWMREVWRRGAEVSQFVLQEDVPHDELEGFTGYWRSQFAGLLNGTSREQPDTKVGREIREAMARLARPVGDAD
jgi:hypothetical protein